jgi:hypothetical protein
MQVHLPLNRPATCAQLLGHIQPNAWPAKTQLIIHVQQGGGVKLVAQALVKHGLIVLDLLECDGVRWWCFEAHPFLVLNGQDVANSAHKKILL